MQPESSLPLSKLSAICPSLEPEQSSPCLPSHSLKMYLNNNLPSIPESFKLPLFLRFPYHAPLLFPIRATYPVHLIFLDLITRMTFGEESRLLSSYNESKRDALFLKFIVKVLYMFRTSSLFNTRSISTLYTRNRYLSC